MPARQVRFWPPNGNFYRPILSLDSPWAPEPQLVSGTYEWDPILVNGETKEWDDASEPSRLLAEKSSRRSSRWRRRFWRYLARLFNMNNNNNPLDDDIVSRFGPRPTAADFKAYGQWARPWINGVCIDNTAPRTHPTPPRTDIHTLFQSLIGPHGSPHPEHWPPGLTHHSLPPRPPHWSAPTPGDPLPFPWECTLNFFLQHRSVGLHPLLFDIGRETSGIVFSLPREVTVPCWPGDMAQPATWPFVTHMHIRGVADDVSGQGLGGWPWPFTVWNEGGVTCGDVFEAVFENFAQLVPRGEYEMWNGRRREYAGLSYWQRVRKREEQVVGVGQGLGVGQEWWGMGVVEGGGEGVVNDGLRRIDYMGDRVMFRGLEPSPEKDGTWLMFTGPP